jgi:predicted peptidase
MSFKWYRTQPCKSLAVAGVLAMVAVLLIAPAGEGSPALQDVFEACEHRYYGGQYKSKLFRYRLFVPSNIQSGERYPLLVWLHGLGENGEDNTRSLGWLKLILDDLDHLYKYRYFILVVQCPPTNRTWFRSPRGVSEGNEDDMVAVTFDILQKTLAERPIDEDRVYLAGLSAGGAGCWEMAMRYPDVFAAVVPLASAGGDTSRASRLVNIPIWAFNNRDDPVSPLARVKKTVVAVQAAGGNVYLTVFPKGGHDAWTEALRDHHAMDWMLAQRRRAWTCWTPPGTYPWKWRHVLAIPGLFLTTIWLGWRFERKRRLRKMRRASATKHESTTGLPGSDMSTSFRLPTANARENR